MTNTHVLILDSAADKHTLEAPNTPDGCVHGCVPCCQTCAFDIVRALDRARLVTVPGVERGPDVSKLPQPGSEAARAMGTLLGERRTAAIVHRVNNWWRLCDERDAALAEVDRLRKQVTKLKGATYGDDAWMQRVEARDAALVTIASTADLMGKGRKFSAVMGDILGVIPAEETELIAAITKVRDDAGFKAPEEAYLNWGVAEEVLVDHIGEMTEEWHHAIGAMMRNDERREDKDEVKHEQPGKDGDVFLGADTTFTRNMYFNSLQVAPGVKLNSDGHKIFVRHPVGSDVLKAFGLFVSKES